MILFFCSCRVGCAVCSSVGNAGSGIVYSVKCAACSLYYDIAVGGPGVWTPRHLHILQGGQVRQGKVLGGGDQTYFY